MPTIYVATDGNDSNDGSAPDAANAKLTLAGGLAAASDGDTVELVAGTYSGQTNIGAAHNAKDITVKPYQAGAVTLSTTGSAWTILTLDEAATKTIEFQDLTISIGDSTREYPVYCLGQKSLTFTRCTFTPNAATRYCAYAITGTNSTSRVLTLTDCACDLPSTGRGIVGVVDGDIAISGGTYSIGNATYPVMQAAGTIGTATLSGVTCSGGAGVVGAVVADTLEDGAFTIENCTLTDLAAACFDGVASVDSLSMTGNTLTGDSSNAARTCILGIPAINSGGFAVVRNNTLTDFNGGISYVGSECDLLVADNTGTLTSATNSYVLNFGADDWVTVDPENADLGTLKGRTICIGNDFTVTGDADRHAAYLGMEYAGIVFCNNRVVNRVDSALFGLVVKAAGATVVGNVIHAKKDALYMVGARGCTITQNTFVADTESGLQFDDQGRNPEGNAIFNNLFDAPAYAIDWADLADTFGNYVDFNFFSGVNCRFNNEAYTSMAALEAAQAAYTLSNGDAMHDNCRFGETLAINTTNYRSGNRAAYVYGRPTPGQQLGTLGAFQKRQGRSPALLIP